jgi:hypothetical protein
MSSRNEFDVAFLLTDRTGHLAWEVMFLYVVLIGGWQVVNGRDPCCLCFVWEDRDWLAISTMSTKITARRMLIMERIALSGCQLLVR